MQVFWAKGFAATSLDDLAAAMGMNRPSIYNAFGNKEAIYRTALARFCGQAGAGLEAALGGSDNLEEGLVTFFDHAIELYCSGEPALGCLMICTAPAEAINRPDVGGDLRTLIEQLDQAFTRHLSEARRNGSLADTVEPTQAAKLLQATLQTLALRARAGESKSSLRQLARYAVRTLVA